VEGRPPWRPIILGRDSTRPSRQKNRPRIGESENEDQTNLTEFFRYAEQCEFLTRSITPREETTNSRSINLVVSFLGCRSSFRLRSVCVVLLQRFRPIVCVSNRYVIGGKPSRLAVSILISAVIG